MQIGDCLTRRYNNEPHAELAVAAAEQMKITELRLQKLITDRLPPAPTLWDGPIAAVTRRAGLLKAQLGAPVPVVSSSSNLSDGCHINGGSLVTPRES